MIDLGRGPVHLFAQPVGADFPRAVVAGLRDRFRGTGPEDMARVTLIVNTARMARRQAKPREVSTRRSDRAGLGGAGPINPNSAAMWLIAPSATRR